MMKSRYRTLDIANLAITSTYVNPSSPVLSLDSPATMFMTDLLQVHPVVVPSNTSVTDALNIMKNAYVRLLLVSDDEEFKGIITATDINSGKVLAFMASNEIKSRDEVLVRHIMVDKEHIHGLDYDQVVKASIGDILETIKHVSEQHILVVEKTVASYSVRGIFSTTDIAKSLHIKFDVEPQAKTFFELEHVILHHRIDATSSH